MRDNVERLKCKSPSVIRGWSCLYSALQVSSKATCTCLSVSPSCLICCSKPEARQISERSSQIAQSHIKERCLTSVLDQSKGATNATAADADSEPIADGMDLLAHDIQSIGTKHTSVLYVHCAKLRKVYRSIHPSSPHYTSPRCK
jgi:hypothetical protein